MSEVVFGSHVDLNGNEIRNVRLQALAADPSPTEARIYYNTVEHEVRVYNGTAWVQMGTLQAGDIGAGLQITPGSVLEITFGTPTGTASFGQSNTAGTATTVARSDHHHAIPAHDNAAHATVNLSALASPTADISLNNHQLLSVSALDLTQAALSAGSLSVAVSLPVQFSSFSSSAYRSAEYLLQLSQSFSYAQTKVLIIHNGDDVGISEYAQVGIGADIEYSLDAVITGGNCEIMISCPTAPTHPVTVKFSRVLFDT